MNVILESGLDGAGPSPMYLHRSDEPAAGQEGCVFRIVSDDSEPCLVNAQAGFGYATAATVWEAASAVLLIAKGATYFLKPQAPPVWTYLSDTGIECVFSPDAKISVISSYDEVIAINQAGEELWRRTVAIDGVVSLRIENGLVHGQACHDPPDDWAPFTLRLADGSVVG
ncbi:hypothetical protein [Blastopirellula marina]|uniref:Uncharacterized protein n=1 Tax=Blastopirellula marina TaxID=124 RepID=A0A2S8F3Q1_9BACT|nr:hypothetical protein [Blastopirellula marina]PQO26564.1 hypothetical protein C5Y98_29695 [Blastopirellula marina]PTL40875.1 hypothetical protein C5Y97_29710 [Blastopirellula marina]